MKKNRCWEGYKPTPGKKPFSEGSCMKKCMNTIKKAMIKPRIVSEPIIATHVTLPANMQTKNPMVVEEHKKSLKSKINRLKELQDEQRKYSK